MNNKALSPAIKPIAICLAIVAAAVLASCSTAGGGSVAGKSIHGTIYYGDAPISSVTSLVPDIQVGHYDSSQGNSFSWISDSVESYDKATGAYTISGLPTSAGSFAVFFIFNDKGTASNTLPGNFWYQGSGLTFADGGTYDFHAYAMMHLTAPEDNGQVISGIVGSGTVVPQSSPTLFSWVAPAGASVYKYGVDTYQDSPWTYLSSQVAMTSTSDTSVSLNLPISATGQHYEMYLGAYDAAGDKVGEYRRTAATSYGWTYRFNVTSATPSAAAPSLSPAAGSFPANALPLVVRASSATSGAALYYTLDGSMPTETASATCFAYNDTTGISLDGAKRIRIAAFQAGLARSDIVAGDYAFVSSGKSISGKVYFSNELLKSHTNANLRVYFDLYNGSYYDWYPTATYYFDAATSSYYATGLPAAGLGYLAMDMGRSGGITLGGDYQVSDFFGSADLSTIGDAYDVHAFQYIHMTQPRDNGTIWDYSYASGGAADVSTYSGSPTISWAPIDLAAKYSFILSAYTDSGTWISNLGGTIETTATSYASALASSAANQHYRLWNFTALDASGVKVGEYRYAYNNGSSPTLKFKVQ